MFWTHIACLVGFKAVRCREGIPDAHRRGGMVRVCIDAKDDTSNLLLMGMARVECLGARSIGPIVWRESGDGVVREDSPEIESLRDRLMDLIEKRLELGTEGLSPGTIPLRCSTKAGPVG